MQILDLGGRWHVQAVGRDEAAPAQVPGCVHTDLLAAKIIEDPYDRDNESRVQWITATDWIYSRTFLAPAEILQHERVLLRCEGLDTLATLTLNGHLVGRVDNMFRTWEFDVKDFLQEGENSIAVRFASPLPYIEPRQQEHPLPGWSGPREIAGRAWLRKEPCNFGWDWGPVLTTCGIWRPMGLVAFSAARLADVQVLQQHDAGQVTLDVHTEAELTGAAALTAGITVEIDGQTVAKARVALVDGGAAASLPIPDPQLWWPNGMGAQPLYTVTIQLCDTSGDPLDATTRRIGLRTLRLDRHADEWGESFQFVVNGVPYFAKGGNWIPADAFATRLERKDYAHLLQSVADANMNMLRVWGGGIYEDDDFYDLCDELGITIWQDFMFACSTYPAFDDAFLASVRAEAEDNVRRLRHHPCLALWCGNNELEMGLVDENWTASAMSWADYGRLFDQLLPEVVMALDPQHDYWPSSPHSPHGERKEHSSANWGDAHLWDVWHGKKPFEWYRTCNHRFASEFGFQSFPEPKTVRGYTRAGERNVTSYVMEHHQRSGIGNTTIIAYMLDWYRLPTDFDMTLWLSQILHGMAMKYAVEGWRRHMPRTMGTLYWQINDCWPVASWASIDYYGHWKACHYLAKRFNAPLLISGVENPNTGAVEIHLTSDLQEPKAAEMVWRLTDTEGAVQRHGTDAVTTPTGASALLTTLDFSAELTEFGAHNLLLWLELHVDGARVSDNFISFARPKHLNLVEPGIMTVVHEGHGAFVVTLHAGKPALWAWLELAEADARYSDNFFHLVPGAPLSITVTPATPMTRAEFLRQLRVRSLVDTYREAGGG